VSKYIPIVLLVELAVPPGATLKLLFNVAVLPKSFVPLFAP